MPGQDGLDEHGEGPEAEQQPGHGVHAEHGRAVRDRGAEVAAAVGARDADVQVDVHAEDVFQHGQRQDGHAAAPDPGSGRHAAGRAGDGPRVRAHRATSPLAIAAARPWPPPDAPLAVPSSAAAA